MFSDEQLSCSTILQLKQISGFFRSRIIRFCPLIGQKHMALHMDQTVRLVTGVVVQNGLGDGFV